MSASSSHQLQTAHDPPQTSIHEETLGNKHVCICCIVEDTLRRTWSVPRVSTTGHKQSLVRVMFKLAMLTGWKSRMRGYRLRGDSVPLVMTTLWNLLKMGRIARLASRQLHRKTKHMHTLTGALFKASTGYSAMARLAVVSRTGSTGSCIAKTA